MRHWEWISLSSYLFYDFLQEYHGSNFYVQGAFWELNIFNFVDYLLVLTDSWESLGWFESCLYLNNAVQPVFPDRGIGSQIMPPLKAFKQIWTGSFLWAWGAQYLRKTAFAVFFGPLHYYAHFTISNNNAWVYVFRLLSLVSCLLNCYSCFMHLLNQFK